MGDSMMDIFEAIATRRSVRHFTGEPVTDSEIDRILEAGRAAPSGKNNQPWRFIVVRDAGAMERMSQHTYYSRVMREADALIAVFLDRSAVYNRDKDLHGLGACMQNMWLAAHALGVGVCWNGEIINQRQPVEDILDVPEEVELMAVFCLGRPDPEKVGETPRKPMDELVLKRI